MTREVVAATTRCGVSMRGVYGAASECARPQGHEGEHRSIRDEREWTPEPPAALTHEQKVWKAEHELIMAVHTAIDERRVDGDLQAWVDALQALHASEDVVLFETAKGGRGRVL